jgi:hypothetical protein
VVRPPLALGPLGKLQTAVENAAFALLNLPSDPDTAATMSLHHSLVRMQLPLPLREGGFGLNATGVVPDSSADEYQRSLSLHTASFLAAAHCHDALPQAHSTLRTFSQLHFVPTGPYAEPGPSLCASLWRTLVHGNPDLHSAEPLALPPDPSLIPVSADTVTRKVRAARPALSQALTQCSAAQPFRACDSPSHRARLLSLQCRLAGVYLDTVPVTPYLCLSDGDFINGGHFRLGATGTNPHVPATTCCCGRHVQGSGIDHAMSCNRLSGSRLHRHDHWKEALSISARAGCNAHTEPSYTSVGAAAAGRQGARADIEVTLPPLHGPTLLDIFMIHPRCTTYVADASQTRGAAAALRHRDKYQVHAGHLHPGHTFVPASVDTYGHLDRPMMQYLRTRSDVASAPFRAVTRGSFMASAHRELSVALMQSQGYVYRSCALLLAKASGGRCCLERTLLTLIERCVVCVVFVCWLRVSVMPLSVVLGALCVLRLLSILTIQSVSYPRSCRL